MNKLFVSPINAGNYNPELGTVHGIRIESLDAPEGVITWRPIDGDGEVIGTDVFGTNAINPTEETAAALVRAELAATL